MHVAAPQRAKGAYLSKVIQTNKMSAFLCTFSLTHLMTSRSVYFAHFISSAQQTRLNNVFVFPCSLFWGESRARNAAGSYKSLAFEHTHSHTHGSNEHGYMSSNNFTLISSQWNEVKGWLSRLC